MYVGLFRALTLLSLSCNPADQRRCRAVAPRFSVGALRSAELKYVDVDLPVYTLQIPLDT